jgi:hypothetical protein
LPDVGGVAVGYSQHDAEGREQRLWDEGKHMWRDLNLWREASAGRQDRLERITAPEPGIVRRSCAFSRPCGSTTLCCVASATQSSSLTGLRSKKRLDNVIDAVPAGFRPARPQSVSSVDSDFQHVRVAVDSNGAASIRADQPK